MERAVRPCPSPRFLLQRLCPGTFVLPMLNCMDGIEKPFKSSLKTSRDLPFPPLQAHPPPRPCGWAGGAGGEPELQPLSQEPQAGATQPEAQRRAAAG